MLVWWCDEWGGAEVRCGWVLLWSYIRMVWLCRIVAQCVGMLVCGCDVALWFDVALRWCVRLSLIWQLMSIP